ncbi:MAG: FimV/HubP family polar landmark protein [Thiohalomonadaceae bacterium]
MRKLKSFLLALLLAPAAAYPLGLGDIRLHSGLNQPLSAEIDLLSVAADDVSSIVASLASSDAFQQLDLDRPMALMAIEFSVEQRPNGTYFIKAVSERPMREPFLDFLVEVNWRSGRLVREYTVLLDPPELMKKEAPPAVRAPVTAARAGTTGKRAPGSARGVAVTGKGATPAGPRTYGPVRDNETLWSIANKLRPDASVTVPQVMMALLKGNPGAFEDNNVNRLRAGTVLRLDPALLKAMDRAEAAREVARQDRAWQDFKQQAADEARSRVPTGEATVPRSAAAVKAEEPRLKLVAPEAAEPGKTDSSGTAGKDAQALEGLKKELLLAQEAGMASKQEAEELRTRLQELENQITAMERLLSLKDDDLAMLQRQLGKAVAAPAAEPGMAAAMSEAPQATEQATAGAAPTQATPSVVSAAGPQAATVAEATASPAAPAPQADAAQTEEPKPLKKPRRPLPPPPPPEPTLLEALLANPVYSGLFLLLGLALTTLAVLVVRRRRSNSNFTESILMGGTPSMGRTPEAKAGEESSFFSDFAVSGMGDIQTEDSEVDPLTEADVYMAYQRYQQAEDLVRDALKHNPERPELHVKLLEVYHATQDKSKFEAEALKTHALLNGTGPLWDKVLVLGHELLPEHDLFAKAPTTPVPAGPDHVDARLDDEVLDIGLDLDALTEEMESGASDFNLDLGVDFSDLEDLEPGKTAATPAGTAAPAAAEEPAFDLDLDALAGESPASPASAPEPAAADTALDFDLGDLSLDEPVVEPVPEQEAVPDFDLSELTLEEPEAAATATPATLQDDGGLELADFDLAELDLGDAESRQEGEPDPVDPDAEPMGELNLADLDTGTDALGVDAMALPEQETDDDLLLGDINEVDTKLDLARAYMGMGDNDGARNLLDEVMQEGDAMQKQQAGELLKQIA